MTVSCSVLGCTYRSEKGRKISFHNFPRNLVLIKKWLIAMKRENFKPSFYSKICSRHFRAEDFKINFGQKRLKPNAVPSIFDFPTLKDNDINENCPDYDGKIVNCTEMIAGPLTMEVEATKSITKDIEKGSQPNTPKTNPTTRNSQQFKLENDVENWQKFKLMGYKLKIKNDVVPHNNLDEKKRDETISQVSSSTKKRIDIKESKPSESATQNATQGNSSHSEQLHIKEEPLEADPSDYRLYQQLRDSIKTEPDNSDTVSNNSDTEKHIHSISTDKEHFLNVKKEYSDSCENEISVNHETEQIPMFESVFVKEEPFEEDFPL